MYEPSERLKAAILPHLDSARMRGAFYLEVRHTQFPENPGARFLMPVTLHLGIEYAEEIEKWFGLARDAHAEYKEDLTKFTFMDFFDMFLPGGKRYPIEENEHQPIKFDIGIYHSCFVSQYSVRDQHVEVTVNVDFCDESELDVSERTPEHLLRTVTGRREEMRHELYHVRGTYSHAAGRINQEDSTVIDADYADFERRIQKSMGLPDDFFK